MEVIDNNQFKERSTNQKISVTYTIRGA